MLEESILMMSSWTTMLMCNTTLQLMYDASGEGWIKHILHGTSQLLQFRGPALHLSGKGRRFFFTVRIFEISRALIYSSKTFLAQKKWRTLMDHMWLGDGVKDWHPKEALYDLMVSCSALFIRYVSACNSQVGILLTSVQRQPCGDELKKAVRKYTPRIGRRRVEYPISA